MNVSRRSFIKSSSVLTAGAALTSAGFTNKHKQKEKLAIQLYSTDREMYSNAANTLHTLRDIGYENVEHAGYTSGKFYGYSPIEFKNLVKSCGLTLVSGHASLELQHWNNNLKDFTYAWKRTVQDAAIAGQQYLITPWLDHSLWNDEIKLKRFTEVLNKCGELCKKHGLQFGYHNHGFEFDHFFGNETLYDIILNYTDPNLVTQQLDIGNIYKKDVSVNNLFKRYASRFELMHVKDMRNTYNRNQLYSSTVIGNGDVDLKTIMKSARKQGGTSCFIIEQDCFENTTPLDCARKNYTSINLLKAMPKHTDGLL